MRFIDEQVVQRGLSETLKEFEVSSSAEFKELYSKE